jgi:hypothetical protein
VVVALATAVAEVDEARVLLAVGGVVRGDLVDLVIYFGEFPK